MAQLSNTFETFDAVGGREDLQNVIYDISPTDTPFMSSIGTGSASAVKHEWQTDSLAAAASKSRPPAVDVRAIAPSAVPCVFVTTIVSVSWFSERWQRSAKRQQDNDDDDEKPTTTSTTTRRRQRRQRPRRPL